MDPLPGEVGVHGNIHWAKLSYLRRVEEKFAEAYRKRKDEMGDEPFFIGKDPTKAWLERERLLDEERQRTEAAAAAEVTDTLTDVYSLIGITKGPVRKTKVDSAIMGGPVCGYFHMSRPFVPTISLPRDPSP